MSETYRLHHIWNTNGSYVGLGIPNFISGYPHTSLGNEDFVGPFTYLTRSYSDEFMRARDGQAFEVRLERVNPNPAWLSSYTFYPTEQGSDGASCDYTQTFSGSWTTGPSISLTDIAGLNSGPENWNPRFSLHSTTLDGVPYPTTLEVGTYKIADGVFPDYFVEVRDMRIENLIVEDDVLNYESAQKEIRIRGDLVVNPANWTPISNADWSLILRLNGAEVFSQEYTLTTSSPDTNGKVGDIHLDLDVDDLPEKVEGRIEAQVVARIYLEGGGFMLSQRAPVNFTITRCRCENEEALGGKRTNLPIIIHTSPLGQNLNPNFTTSSTGGCVIPSLASESGWSSPENSGIVPNSNGGFSYQDANGRTHSWDEDNGDYNPRFPDNLMKLSIDSGSTDKRYTITFPDGTKLFFNADGKITYLEDTNGNITTYAHQATYFSISDGLGRATYYHRTAADKPPSVISDNADPDDPDARSYHLTYYGTSDPAPGRLETIVDPEGNETKYTYNTDGQIIEVREVRPTLGDRVIAYEYYEPGHPDAGRLKTTTVFGLYKETKEYNMPIETFFGTKTTFEDLTPDNENENREMFQVLDSLGRTIRTYELHSTVPEPQYNVTIHEYNDPNAPPPDPLPSDPNDIQESNDPYLPVKTITPNGAITEYKYTPRGNVKKVIDAQGNSTVFVYAEQDDTSNIHTAFPDKILEVHRSPVTVNGNLVTYPPTKFSYHATTGNLLSVEDPNVIGTDGQFTTFQYNGEGQITEITNRLGFKTRFEYDSGTANLLRMGIQKTLDPEDDDINTDFRYLTFTYDDNDNIESVTDDLGNGTFSVYDKIDRLKEFTDAVGELYEYNHAERVMTQVTIPDNSGSNETRRKTTPTYDPAGRLLALYRDIDSSNQEFRVGYKYDGFSQVTALTRTKLGNPEDFVAKYDILGRQIESKDPLGQVTRSAYEPFCIGGATTSARQVRTKSDFDSLCRLTELKVGSPDPDPEKDMELATLSESRIFTYDELGRLTKTLQGNYPKYGKAVFGESKYGALEGDTRSYEYDVLDRLTKMVFEDGKEMHFEYDFEGNLTKVSENASSATPVVTEYSYYGDNLLHTVTFKRSGGDMMFTYSYDDAGRLAEIEYPSSTGITAFFDDGASPADPGWDGNGRLTHLRYVKGGDEIRRLEYTYDASGNRETHKDIPLAGDAKLWVYKHDWLDRLTEVSFHADSDPENLDRELATLQSSYAYDASDNRISFKLEVPDETYLYTYDKADNLEKIEKMIGTDPAIPWEDFTFDEDGNIRTRINSSSILTTYHWNEFNRLEKITTSDNSKEQSHTFDVNGFRRKKKDKNDVETTEYAPGLATAVAKSQAETFTYLMGHQLLGFQKEDGSINFFLHDGLSTVRDVVRGTDGAVMASYEFSEYGQKISPANTGGVESQKTFVGGLSVQDEVADTGLMLMGHRFYDASLGRFLNRDPIGFSGGLNLYSYANGNPTTFTDHTGLQTDEYMEGARPLWGGGNSGLGLGDAVSEFFRHLLKTAGYVPTPAGGVAEVIDIAIDAQSDGGATGEPCNPLVKGIGKKAFNLLKKKKWPGLPPQGTYLKGGKHGIGWTSGQSMARDGYINKHGDRIWKDQGQWTESALEQASLEAKGLIPGGPGKRFPLDSSSGAIVFKAHTGEQVPAAGMWLRSKNGVFHGYPTATYP